MGKTALATQVSEKLKDDLDSICEERGLTISRIVEEALRERIDEMREEEALVEMALSRLAEPGEHSHKEFERLLSRGH
ncbi:MAG: ribbon-helix-helix protein, CopG family [Pseudomonadota bacterium]